jgi:hypothetical protein
MSEINAAADTTSRKQLLAALAELARKHWDDTQPEHQPLLLSNIPQLLKLRGLDYREILGEQRLKDFAHAEESTATFAVVTHPVHKAKVGIIPSDETYTFPDDTPLTEAGPGRGSLRLAPTGGHAVATIRFLRALAELPEEDLNGIVIPTRVLVKLFAQR